MSRIKLNKEGSDKYAKFINNDFKKFIKDNSNIEVPLDLKSVLLYEIEISKCIDQFLIHIDLKENKIEEDIGKLVLNSINNYLNLPQKRNVPIVIKNDISQENKTILLRIISITWCWHIGLRKRFDKIDDKLFCFNYILSWINLCRTLNCKLISIDNIDLSKSSFEFKFIQDISHYEKIIISKEKICNYSLKLLWQSIVLLWPCLYKYPYSDDMRIYFITLYSYYCNILTFKNSKFTDNDYPKYYRIGSDSSSSSTVTNLIDAYSDKFDYNNLDLDIDDNKVLKSCFIFDTELIFYHQLIRITTLNNLFNLNKQYTLKYYYNDNNNNKVIMERIIKMIECFKDAILSLIENQFLKTEIWEELKSNLSKLYLMHGESERFIRENFLKTKRSHPDDILNKLRQNDYQKINGLKEKIAKDFILEYTNDILNFIQLNLQSNDKLLFENYQKTIFKSEKEAIFLTLSCFEKWFSLLRIDINIKNILFYELISDIETIEDIVDNFNSISKDNKNIPVFITIMKHSFVIDKKNKKIFHSLFFIEAFTIWIILLIKQRILLYNNDKNNVLSKFKNFDLYINIV